MQSFLLQITRLVAVLLVSASATLAFPPARSGTVLAVQETEPEIVAAVQKINLYRSWLGIAPLTIDPHLQRAAEAHVEYYRLNYGDPSLAGMGLHYETPGRPGFTGESFQDRADAAGYDGWVNENAGLSGSMLWSLDWFIATVGHRLTLIDPRYTHIGLAAIDDGEMRFEIIDLGAPEWEYETTPEWVAWPPDGATGVSLSFSGEAPDPFPDADYPVGYPITLKYHGPGDLVLDSATISVGGEQLPSFAEVGDGWLTRKTVQLCASEPLEPGTLYEVQVRGSANGQPFNRSWSFTTTNGDDDLALDDGPGITPIAPPEEQLPPGVQGAEPAIQQVWWEVDGPVASGEVVRSWLWGPDAWLGTREPSLENADGERQVYYFDKARLEVNPASDDSTTQITAGLLVRDMIAGRVPVGRDEFVAATPADIPLAGDPGHDNPDAPTYASLTSLASIDPGREAEVRTGDPIKAVLHKSGDISSDEALGSVRYGTYEPGLGHNLAAVFETYFSTLPNDWRMSVGLPLSEPYWVQTRVAGDLEWVLVQAFERRVLTYTPSNAAGWEVEMGNIGRHYYTWRYGQQPQDGPDA